MTAASFPWTQVSASVILAFAVWLILTGRLVPRSFLQQTREQGEQWKQLFNESQDNVSELVGMVKDLTETSKTSEKMLRDIVDMSRGSSEASPKGGAS